MNYKVKTATGSNGRTVYNIVSYKTKFGVEYGYKIVAGSYKTKESAEKTLKAKYS